MGMAQTLTNELTALSILAIIIVIFIVVLSKIKNQNIGGVTCSNGIQGYYNITGGICCNGTESTLVSCNSTGSQAAVSTGGSFIDGFVTGLGEPKNWIAIIVIALVGFGIIKYVKSKKD